VTTRHYQIGEIVRVFEPLQGNDPKVDDRAKTNKAHCHFRFQSCDQHAILQSLAKPCSIGKWIQVQDMEIPTSFIKDIPHFFNASTLNGSGLDQMPTGNAPISIRNFLLKIIEKFIAAGKLTAHLKFQRGQNFFSVWANQPTHPGRSNQNYVRLEQHINPF